MENTSAETICERLRALGYSPKVMEHDPVVTMADVVQTLDIPSSAMAKTILFSQVKIGLIAVVLPGMSRIDYAKVASTLSVSRNSLKIATPETLAETGLKVGEVCPFHEFIQKVIVDVALLIPPLVYCGSGDQRKTIVIDPKEMVKATSATMASVSSAEPKEESTNRSVS